MKILFPADLNEMSALPWAKKLASEHNAELHIVFVQTPDSIDPSHPPSLERMVKQCDCPVISRIVRARQPDKAILSYVDECGIDLVVMGTHGRRGLRHLFFGSVAEGVLKGRPGPVLLIKEGMQVRQVKQILIPTDLSKNSARALGGAQALFPKADLRFLNVVEHGLYPALVAVDSVLELDPGLKGRVKKLTRELFSLGMDARVDVLEGKAAKVIVSSASHADLVVLSNNGYDEVEDLLIGSTTERVIRSVGVPVLVV